MEINKQKIEGHYGILDWKEEDRLILGYQGGGGRAGLVLGRISRQTTVKEAFIKNVQSRIISSRN